MNNTITSLAAGALLCATAAAFAQTSPAHIAAGFDFDVDAPFAKVAPQFGPEAERAWGDPEWNPRFVFPQPAKDVQGAVFTLQHGEHTVVWVNTLFDVGGGRMQYVYVIPEIMTTVIDVRVLSEGPARTHVAVTYTRTALSADANAIVSHFAEQDKTSAADWKRHVEHALQSK